VARADPTTAAMTTSPNTAAIAVVTSVLLISSLLL
jgi:hypothetical protein